MGTHNTEEVDVLPVRVDIFRDSNGNVNIRIADNIDSVLLSWDRDHQKALEKAKATLSQLFQQL